MKEYLDPNPQWNIVERNFHEKYNRVSESLMSLGNGHMGQRGNFEEDYSGDSLQGNYVAGVYYPDKTRVGWWKNGYPSYFAKILNSIHWIGVHIILEGETLDLHKCQIEEFERNLDMKKGLLSRKVRGKTSGGRSFIIDTQRFLSMERKDIGALKYRFQIEGEPARLEIQSYADGNVYNEDSNYQESFWEPHSQQIKEDHCYLQLKTKKTEFHLGCAMVSHLTLDGKEMTAQEWLEEPGYYSYSYDMELKANQSIELTKFISMVSSRDYPSEELMQKALDNVNEGQAIGWEFLKKEQEDWWDKKWMDSDIILEGEPSAQQGIRFNIFQLNQTYQGHDARLNIGPKGFTGEKYGGTTYWDTEAYCLPFYLSTAPPEISKNLLLYRYRHLEKAIENAEKLGFNHGAALYPMVTINGEECHNEWEITFEEIHRNGAIAYGIFNYIRYTGDWRYLEEAGLEVLIAIARFWAQRVNWSEEKKAYVILGVTGPNEYENNVNNNWYTNKIAAWTMNYCHESLLVLQKESPTKLIEILKKCNFSEKESLKFVEIARQIYLPFDSNRNVFLQQDGFLDKSLIPVTELSQQDRPLNQNWSWDRILRSCYIKQADVLQGIYFFEEEFDQECITRNFHFYEPFTVHESSLSPCVYSILASLIGEEEKAYELYHRTARLDLDDYNNDTEDGCHITSMAGTWMTILYGFAGFRVKKDQAHLNPKIPKAWTKLQFHLQFRGRKVEIILTHAETRILLKSGSPMKVNVNSQELDLKDQLIIKQKRLANG